MAIAGSEQASPHYVLTLAHGAGYVAPTVIHGALMHHLRSCLRIGAFVLLAASTIAPVSAAAQDFYRGNTIEIIISTEVCGGLDAKARAVARHLVNPINVNTTIVPETTPRAGQITNAQ